MNLRGNCRQKSIYITSHVVIGSNCQTQVIVGESRVASDLVLRDHERRADGVEQVTDQLGLFRFLGVLLLPGRDQGQQLVDTLPPLLPGVQGLGFGSLFGVQG